MFHRLASSWLPRLFGVGEDAIPADADVELVWTNAPRSWGVFLLLAISAGLIWLVWRFYRTEKGSCPMWMRRLLAGLRVLVILILVLVYLGPALTYRKTRSLRPVIAVLRDASQSMNEPDRYLLPENAGRVAKATGKSPAEVRSGMPTRVALTDHLLQSDGAGILDAIRDRARVRVLDFAGRVTEVALASAREGGGDGAEKEPDASESPRPAFLPPLKATGPATDLAKAIQEALSERLLSAIAILTDGQHNVGSDAEAAARAAAARGVPVFFVGLGDPQRKVNLEVADLYADPQVWKDDPFEIQAVVRAQGVGEEEVKAELVEVILAPGGGEPERRVLKDAMVRLPAEGGQARVSFAHTPKEPGLKSFTVRVQELENESSTGDNEPPAPVQVRVLDLKARVLLIAGQPSWEYRTVQRLLTREPMIDVSCWLQSIDDNRPQQGNTPIARLPGSRDELFQYDVILMLDPAPREFGEAWAALLREFVDEHAGGFLYMPGPIYSGRFLGGGPSRAIEKLLPVKMGDVGGMEVAGLLATSDREWALGVVPRNLGHPVMKLFPDDDGLARWKALSGIYWSFPALEAKPSARVLIEHSDPSLRRNETDRPLLVTGQFGAGRTAYVGFDGTWRWRSAGTDSEVFNRFWVQLTRYLVEGRALAGKRRGVVETERFRYQLGESVRVSARLKTENYRPLEAAEVVAQVRTPEGEDEKLALSPVPNEPGRYEATFNPRIAGAHVVRVQAGGEAAAGGIDAPVIEAAFSVTYPMLEARATWLDKPRLVKLAGLTRGKYLDIDDAAALPGLLPARLHVVEMQSQPVSLWDNIRVLLVLVGLLTLEWALRKRAKLL